MAQVDGFPEVLRLSTLKSWNQLNQSQFSQPITLLETRLNWVLYGVLTESVMTCFEWTPAPHNP